MEELAYKMRKEYVWLWCYYGKTIVLICNIGCFWCGVITFSYKS